MIMWLGCKGPVVNLRASLLVALFLHLPVFFLRLRNMDQVRDRNGVQLPKCLKITLATLISHPVAWPSMQIRSGPQTATTIVLDKSPPRPIPTPPLPFCSIALCLSFYPLI